MSSANALQLKNCGFDLFKLRKTPKDPDYKTPWVDDTWKKEHNLSDQELAGWNHFGWMVEPGLCIFDADYWDRIPEEGQQALIKHGAVATSQSGKKHYMFKDPGNLPKDIINPETGEKIGEWLRPMSEYAKIVGGKCSQTIEFLQRDVEPVPPVLLGLQRTGGNGRDTMSLSVPEDFSTLPTDGSRNTWLNALSGKLCGAGIDGETVANIISTMATPLGQDQQWVKAHIQSTIPRYVAEYERSGSYQEPEQADDLEELFTLYSVEDVINGDWPKPTCLHEDLRLYTGCAAMLVGEPEAGKSALLLQALFEMNKPTILVYAEGNMSQLQHRYARPSERNITAAVQKEPNDFLRGNYDPYEVIAIDTKAGAYTSKHDENSVEHWRDLRVFCEKWKTKNKLIILVHHVDKAGSDYRGSSDARALVDVEIKLMKDLHKSAPENGRYLQIIKNKMSGTKHKIHYQIEGDGYGPKLYLNKVEYEK